MKVFSNNMRREAERVQSQRMPVRFGRVASYDPVHYAVKVVLLPDGAANSGWLPLSTAWVGNGWGLFAAPNLGDIVEVHFEDGNLEAGFVVNRFFSDQTRPLAAPSGEFWLVHQSGAFFKLTNDGRASFRDAAGSTLTLNNDGTTILNSNLIVNGSITSTGDITDHSGSTNESMSAMRTKYNSHVHPGVQSGGSNTGNTLQTM